jgi:hypothetical protein
MDSDQQKAITVYQDITGGKRIVAMLKMKEQGELDTERLSEAVDTFSQKIKENDKVGHVKEIVAQVDFEKIAGLTDFVYQNIPMMLQDSDYVRMEQILSNPRQVEDQLAKDVQMIMMPATGYFANNISYDPLSLFTPLMTRLQERQASSAFEIEASASQPTPDSPVNTIFIGFICSFSGNDFKREFSANIEIILFLIFHLEISGNVFNDVHR